MFIDIDDKLINFENISIIIFYDYDYKIDIRIDKELYVIQKNVKEYNQIKALIKDKINLYNHKKFEESNALNKIAKELEILIKVQQRKI